jgi:hypothetical protein
MRMDARAHARANPRTHRRRCRKFPSAWRTTYRACRRSTTTPSSSLCPPSAACRYGLAYSRPAAVRRAAAAVSRAGRLWLVVDIRRWHASPSFVASFFCADSRAALPPRHVYPNPSELLCVWVFCVRTQSLALRLVKDARQQRGRNAQSFSAGIGADEGGDGGEADEWVMVDLGTIHVHLFTPAGRRRHAFIEVRRSGMRACIGARLCVYGPFLLLILFLFRSFLCRWPL